MHTSDTTFQNRIVSPGYRVYRQVQNVNAMLRDPASCLPLAAGASSRNLAVTFLHVCMCPHSNQTWKERVISVNERAIFYTNNIAEMRHLVSSPTCAKILAN